MIGLGEGHIFHNHDNQPGGAYLNDEENLPTTDQVNGQISHKECEQYFRKFLHTYNSAYLARKLMENVRFGKHILDISCKDILDCKPLPTNQYISTPIRNNNEPPVPSYYLEQLYKALTLYPLHYLPTCEQVCYEEALKSIHFHNDRSNGLQEDNIEIPSVQINLLHKSRKPMLIRELLADIQEKFVVVSGIIIQASKTIHKMNVMTIQCRFCDHKMQLSVPPWREKPPIPRQCEYSSLLSRNKGDTMQQSIDKGIGCKGQIDPYAVVANECSYIDVQSLKLQELPEHVPTGDMPRHLQLNSSRNLCETMTPGDRVYVHGVLTSYDSNPKAKRTDGTSHSYLHVLGIQKYETAQGEDEDFTIQEKAYFQALAQSPDIHSKIFKSIAPAIYGMENVKKAAACLLFGGVRKETHDHTKLRGDINILLLGDPSVAKSQILKYVDKLADISVYTSGKGSSAAGLTAAVLRDRHGVFSLEGGAMVLADGGIVCIDEFDKMNENDVVAIHEAMEQQTISISKAGITTILNSRCSVLAAANPTFGSLDSSYDTAEQHEFKATILSRFDLIFLLRDHHDVEKDTKLCAHIVSLHAHKQIEEEGEIPFITLKKYIKYCKKACTPALSADVATFIKNFYTQNRAHFRGDKQQTSKYQIPITIRQLESIVRLAESLARMELKSIATAKHAQMAIELFTVSTAEAVKHSISYEYLSNPEKKAVKKAEEAILGRLPIGQRTGRSNLLRDLEMKGLDERILKIALFSLIRNKFLQERADHSLVRF